jgi:uncharacterized protein YcbK (DUF882 family)
MESIHKQMLALTIILFAILACIMASEATGPPESRYFYSGDGTINISNEKNNESFKGTYRTQDGSYDPKALKKIYSVFGARYGEPVSEISPRLVEFLDFIADSLRPEGQIEIISGWRSPEYNRKLKQKGRLAAKASLHQYGMAADLKIKGVSSKHIWNYVKELGYGGAGYYHGELVHIDVGPPRFWDEKTSGVDTGISDDNKLIGLVTDRDIYLPGETLTLRFIRMTAFPIGVSPEFILEHMEEDGHAQKITTFKPLFAIESRGPCPQFHDIGQMLGITWKLPQGLQAGHYQIRSSFCEKQWENMPQDITTPGFEIFIP